MKMQKKLIIGALVAVLASAHALAQVQEADEPETWSQWSVTTGIDYSKGDYGEDEDTTMLYAPLTVRYELQRVQFAVTVPFVWSHGPGSVIPGTGGPNTGTTSDVKDRYGIGDVTLAATYNIYPETADSLMPFIELTGKVKLPTGATSKFLSSGSTDYTIQVDAFKAIGNVTPFAMVGYKIRGDADEDVYGDLDLRNSIIASAGAVVKVNNQFSVGGSVYYSSPSSDNAQPAMDIMPFVILKPSKDWSLTGYGTIGLSNASPDYGAGIQVKRRF